MSDREVVFITGTRKGIGRYLVRHFSKKGVIIEGCSRKPVDWKVENYNHHIADVTDENQIKLIFSYIQKKYNRLDIIINNAGIALMNHTLLTPISTVNRIMETNFIGTFLVCREGAKLMKKRNYGRIVNISTIAVPLHLEGEAIYASSKNAVTTFTKILAHELADYGITCNVIGPTPIQTDLIRSIPKEKIDRLINKLAIKRLGRFDDVTNVIDFFTKPSSDYITGQVIYLGGIS